jgi:hypothetical protein
MANRTLRYAAASLVVALTCALGAPASAQIVSIASDVVLVVNSVNAVGRGLASDTDSTTYSINNALGNKKLVARLSSPMPPNTTLKVQLAAPPGAVSAGQVTLTASDQTLVTGIGIVTAAGLDMTFTLSATVNAPLTNAGTKTLTLTLVDAP